MESKMKKLVNVTQSEVEAYANSPYTVKVEPQDDGRGIYYVARVVELPTLIMTGETREEALKDLEAVKKEWIQTYLELGNKMPVPLVSRKYSGKIIVRMPPTLHELLTKLAEDEGVSFNQYMVSSLARCAGQDEVMKSKNQNREKQTA
jgi:predicted RNase H-like HicB family nuclease